MEDLFSHYEHELVVLRGRCREFADRYMLHPASKTR